LTLRKQPTPSANLYETLDENLCTDCGYEKLNGIAFNGKPKASVSGELAYAYGSPLNEFGAITCA